MGGLARYSPRRQPEQGEEDAMKVTADERRPLGACGLKVSPICLGAMMFGGQTGEAEADRILGSARDAGINFLDTADAYNKGASEEVVGRLIDREREDWVVATKVGNAMGEADWRQGHSRRWLMRAIDESLDRLGTDYVDIWYLHKPDLETPLEETVAAMGDIVASGKVLYWGFSNYRGYQIVDMVRIADSLGAPRPVVSQPYYNAFNRMPEVEVLPACAEFGIGVVPYSPLARGVLTAKYDPDAAPDETTRAGRKDPRMMQTEFRRESLVLAREVKAHAERRGMTPGAFALLWVLNNALVTSVLAGPRTMEQWQGYLDALNHEFLPEDEHFIDARVAEGHSTTPGYNDPAYPILGRAAIEG